MNEKPFNPAIPEGDMLMSQEMYTLNQLRVENELKGIASSSEMTEWWFVYDANGVALAAFPERGLAESYSEGCNWTIRKRSILKGPKVRNAPKRVNRNERHCIV